MNHHDLFERVKALLPEPALASYFVHWASNGRPAPTFISLIPHTDGTVTAMQGDMRERIIPVLDDEGKRRVFVDEASACEWAWSEVLQARRPAPVYSQEEEARFLANGDAKRRLFEEQERTWYAEHGDGNHNSAG